MVIPHLGIDLAVAFAQPVCKSSADILTKCIGTCTSRDDVHTPDCAAEPPGPVRITDHPCPRSRGFPRTMVPTDSADSVGSKLLSQRKMDNWIERPCVLPRTCAGCLKALFSGRVNR